MVRASGSGVRSRRVYALWLRFAGCSGRERRVLRMPSLQSGLQSFVAIGCEFFGLCFVMLQV